jgi:hypothetical protein
LPAPPEWSLPLAPADEEPEPEAAAVYPLTEEDRAFKRARARKMEADADGAEAARLERLGALINRQAAEAEMLSRARALRDRLLAIPAQVADELVGKTDAREIRTLLTARLRLALIEFAAPLTRELEDEAS